MQTQRTCSGFLRIPGGDATPAVALPWLIAIVALFFNGCAAADVRLTVEPLQSPIASALFLHPDGTADFYQYDRYLLVVTAARKGKPSLTALPQAAFGKRYWGQTGIEDGDQFHLDHGGRLTGGVLGAAPTELREWIRRATEIGQTLGQTKLASGYIQTVPVTAERRKTMEDRGRKFAGPEGLPPAVRAAIQRSSSQPGDFVALDDVQSQALRTATGWEYLVVNGSVGLVQTTLYTTK